MDKHKHDIDKYLAGKLTSAEMHALEKKALSDPFLADALEGGAQLDASDFSNDVTDLNSKLTKHKSQTWTWPLRIAATVAFLAVSMFVIWVALKQDTPETLANQPDLLKEDSLPKTAPPTQTPALESNKISAVPSPSESTPESAPATPRASRSKKSSLPKTVENQIKDEKLTHVADAGAALKDSASVPVIERNDTRTFTHTEPVKKEEIQLPTASEIKIAEGYIESIDARPTIVTGRVLSAEDGTPLPDVSVALKGTSVMTKTDANGRYSITANSREKTLVYSSVGLESTEVKIDGIDSTYLPVKIEMTEEAQEEAAVETSGMRDFGPTNVYTIPAHPETGNRAFKQYLERSHKYPKEARDMKVEGTVIVEFKVDATGALSEFRIVRGIGNGCDEEVIRLILQGVKWVPTTKDGTPVNDKARVKFKFELEE